ncbi:MAG: sodium:alanine symporter family protein, partial [Chlamydiia bacterium]|nr:sodium:alanine symporter family protein [Chlamydiia bacterium]
MLRMLDVLYGAIWGGPLLIFLLALGLYLTVMLRGIQFRYLFYSLRLAFFPQKGEAEGKGDISHFQSLMTALAATIGIGNIAGVATAMTVGGLG